ncbi:Eco57I restriction-modification methylase domain-containing protein [Meiothermus rufus]|uniref:Eco57I restriction-modification methylase domain-containing protein n=1 Tax=Meiothermus rufus TaxID=604332 RepID=UPI00042A59BB|nr:DNA methyltransferase [Meiothermus rufus]
MFYSVRISGGLLTEEFLSSLTRPEALKEVGLSLEELEEKFLALFSLYERVRPLEFPDVSQARESWLIPFFRVLGFDPVYNRAHLQVEEQTFPISHLGWNQEEAPPLHLVLQDLDEKPTHRGKSPHGLLQAYLNLHPEQAWGVVANPREVRLLGRYYHVSTPGYVAFYPGELFEAPRQAALREFQVLYLLLSQSRFQQTQGEAPLDRYRRLAREVGVRAKDALKKGVVRALEVLGNAFLSEELRALCQSPERLQAYHQEVLRLVYRLLFLFYAEQRALIPHEGQLSWVYEREYSLLALRERAARLRFQRDDQTDLWAKLLLTFRLVHEGDEALGVPALNGELFAPEAIATLTQRGRSPKNSELLEAIRYLAFVEREGALERVNYRDLEVEEIGHVYEEILALSPRLVEGRYSLESHLLERKSSGSYYTPRELVQLVVQEALAPVLEERLKAAGEDLEAQVSALLSLRVIDPAMGSGAFLISALEYLAQRLAELRQKANPQSEFARLYEEARHEVAARCIYGVDLNPMAVELAKLSLWIAAAARGRPLSFLDHHLKVGNSLVGAPRDFLEMGIPKEAYKREGVPAEVVKGLSFTKKPGKTPLALDNPPPPPPLDYEEKSVQDVEKKRRLYTQWRQSEAVQKWERLADYWVAAFFLRPTPAVRLPDAQGLNWLAQQAHASLAQWENSTYLSPPTLAAIQTAQRRHRFFHWWLEFPEVMGQGGFDVVLGNPPWEQLQFDDREFFITRPDIAEAPNMAKRKAMIERLRLEDPTLWQAYAEAQADVKSSQAYIHYSNRFPLTSYGRINLAPLFAELSRQLLNVKGRAGLIVPTEIATGAFNQHFFADVVAKGELAALYDFENREGIFPGVHRSYKFSILVLRGQGSPEPAWFSFFATRTEHLEDPSRVFSLAPKDFALLNPNTKTCPVFRTRSDAELTKQIYQRVPVLWKEEPEENPWGVRFLLMFMMNTDSNLFRTQKELEVQGFQLEGNRFIRGKEVYLPLYEAKLIWHFDHRFATYNGADIRDMTPAEHASPEALPLPRYWVPQKEVEERLVLRDRKGEVIWRWERDWLMGWRDIARSTDERTFIASVFPRVGAGDTYLQMLPARPADEVALLLGNLSSLVFDYSVRQKAGGTHLKYHVTKQLPVLPPSAYQAGDLRFIVPRVLELTYTAWDLAPFAQDLWEEADEELRELLQRQWEANGGHPPNRPSWLESAYPFPPFRWDEERRALLRAELDAYYARLYGLNRKQLRYILDPKDLTEKELSDILSDHEEVEDPLDERAYRKRVQASRFPGETFRVLKDKDIRRYGEYRTRRLVLQAWERLW